MKRKKVLKSAAIVSLLIISLTGCSLFPKEQERRSSLAKSEKAKSLYKYEKVEQGDITLTAELMCGPNFTYGEDLKFAEDGIEYGEFYVEVGDSVKKGDLLAELCMDDIEDECNEKKLSLELAGAELNYINTQIADQKKSNSINKLSATKSNELLKPLMSSYSSAQEHYNLAKEQYSEIEKKRERRQIYAPYDGTVSYIYTPNGQSTGVELSDSKKGVACIQECGDFTYAAVTEYGDKFKVGMRLDMELGGQTYEMEVSRIEDGWGYGKYIIMSFVDQPQIVASGEGKISQVVDQVTGVLKVSTNSIVTIAGKEYVYVVNKDGVREAKEIETGVSDGTYTEVKSGVKLGEKVIIK